MRLGPNLGPREVSGMADPAHRREPEESHQQDPRIERRRFDVELDALRREMATRRVEAPGPIRTLVDEVRWRRQLRRSCSGGMTATAWVIALLLIRSPCWPSSSPSKSTNRSCRSSCQLQSDAFVVNP